MIFMHTLLYFFSVLIWQCRGTTYSTHGSLATVTTLVCVSKHTFHQRHVHRKRFLSTMTLYFTCGQGLSILKKIYIFDFPDIPFP